MDRLVKHWIPTFIALAAAVLVLLGYLFPGALTFPYRGHPTNMRDVLVEWAVIVASFALLLGLINLLRVHYDKVRLRQTSALYSLAFLLAALGSLLLSFFSFMNEMAEQATNWLIEYVVSPVAASLSALVVFALALAAFQLLRVRRDEKARAAVFVFVVAVILLSSPPLVALESGGLLSMVGLRDWIVGVLGMAGMRGLLMGVALGTVVTALRVLWPRRH